MIIKIGYSRRLAALILAAHLGGGAAAFSTPLPLSAGFALGMLLAVSLYRQLRLHAWRRHPWSVRVLSLDAEGELAIQRGGSVREQCRILACRVLSGWVVMRVRAENARLAENLVVCGDAVAAGPFRHLRAGLNHRNWEV